MSLTSFLDMPDVKVRVKPLRPKMRRQISVPLKVEPRSNRYMLVGTAFDYLLRFELQRLAPHAISERWVVEYAPDLIWKKTSTGARGIDLLADADPAFYMPPEKVAEHARRIVADAKAAVAKYVKNKAPKRVSQIDLAAHAIRLAKLEDVYRALRLDPTFEEAASEDMQDLVEMLAIVPFDELLHPKLMLLNPNFRQTSHLVGNADADLIAGDWLVDFKTTKKNAMGVGDLDQLLGYLLLARRQHSIDPTFPAINRLALYYCRHGHLWSLNACVWTEHSEFQEIEKWFFQRAAEVFGPGTGPGTGTFRNGM
jgi:hypothetical protein